MKTPLTPIVPCVEHIAFCGLYCGACRSFINGKCPGCAKNEKASWCKIRTCCMENGYTSCAECTTHPDAMTCKKFNNAISKIFAFVFKSDRNACLNMIRTSGREDFAKYMAQNRLQSIKRK